MSGGRKLSIAEQLQKQQQQEHSHSSETVGVSASVQQHEFAFELQQLFAQQSLAVLQHVVFTHSLSEEQQQMHVGMLAATKAISETNAATV